MSAKKYLTGLASAGVVCAVAAGIGAGAAALLSGGAIAPVLIGASIGGLVGSVGTGILNYFVLPLMGAFIGHKTDKSEDRGVLTGMGISAAASLLTLGTLTTGYNEASQNIPPAATQNAEGFGCKSGETRVEQILTDAAGNRTLTVTCRK